VKYGRATLYNKANKYTYAKITYKDGKPLPREVEWGNVYLFEDDEWTKPKCNEIVNMAFSSVADRLKEDMISVSLIVDPNTGKVIEVNFDFINSTGFATVAVSTYRKIEEGLKASIYFTLTNEGKSLNFFEVFWRQEPFALTPFDTTLRPPGLIVKN
jgi:hypothetical protein